MSEKDIEKIIELYSVQYKSISYISRLFDCSENKIKKILVSNNIEIRNANFYKSKYVDESFFENIDTEEKAYILGFIYADGYISKTTFGIKISAKDYELLKKIKDILHSEHKIGFCINNNGYGKGNESCYLSINNKKLVNSLIENGVVYNKSNILKFPSYDIVPEHLIRHFIRGYFDGDGSVYRNNSGLVVSFDGARHFLKYLLDILRDVTGTKTDLYKYKNKEHYYIRIGGNNQVKMFYDYIYEDSTIFLGRKKIVFESNLF